MTDEQIYHLYSKATNYNDPDTFASDAAQYLLDSDDPVQEVDIAMADQLHTLWHVANDPFRTLLKRMGLNQSNCSRHFCIPLRTIQEWAGERRSTALYIRLMMAEAMEILNIRD